METSFWLNKWQTQEIGFHEPAGNQLLVHYFSALNLALASRVFIPLCGKTRDIAWLLEKGYRVVGAELSELAITQLFSELGVEPKIQSIGELKHYSADNIDIYVGDIFNLSPDILGPVDAIYDRAALVALPPKIRQQYTAHLRAISANASQLLICFAYDQNLMDGPPFSIDSNEVSIHYSTSYDIHLLASTELAGGLKGKIAAKEQAWLLEKKR